MLAAVLPITNPAPTEPAVALARASLPTHSRTLPTLPRLEA